MWQRSVSLQKVGVLFLRLIRFVLLSCISFAIFNTAQHTCLLVLLLIWLQVKYIVERKGFTWLAYSWCLADSKCTAAGSLWQQLASWGHLTGFAYKGIATYLFSHEQVYFFFSRNCRCIWVSHFGKIHACAI
jgi:hypothetical protein